MLFLTQLLSWIRKVGEETLDSLTLVLRSVGDVAGVKEAANDFEKFFFNAWVSRDASVRWPMLY